MANQEDYDSTSTQQAATSTEMAFNYNCYLETYDSNYQVTATQWNVTKQSNSTMISDHVQTAVKSFESNINPIETPYSKDVVYEGLSHITIDFENECSKYNRCILIIIDDLQDWRNADFHVQTPNLIINLSQAEIISVMPNCKDIIQPSCTKLQHFWTGIFTKSFGARSVVYTNGDGLEDYLINYLGGK